MTLIHYYVEGRPAEKLARCLSQTNFIASNLPLEATSTVNCLSFSIKSNPFSLNQNQGNALYLPKVNAPNFPSAEYYSRVD
jgi:hypothetical protein